MNLAKRVRVTLVKGRGRGRQIGVPTYNFRIPSDFSIAYGVYAGWMSVSGKKYPAAIHFGPRPVYEEKQPTLEAHILGKTVPDISHAETELELVAYIRGVQNFLTPQKMVEQIQKDVIGIKTILKLDGNG